MNWLDVASALTPNVINRNSAPYMERYFLQGQDVRLHHILTSDPDPHMHDHPWDFVSLVLDGQYTEYTPSATRQYGPGDLIQRKAEDLHRLELDAPMWTLVATEKPRRTWGFSTDDGWVPFQQYLGLKPRRSSRTW